MNSKDRLPLRGWAEFMPLKEGDHLTAASERSDAAIPKYCRPELRIRGLSLFRLQKTAELENSPAFPRLLNGFGQAPSGAACFLHSSSLLAVESPLRLAAWK